jgi:hypothetical protein
MPNGELLLGDGSIIGTKLYKVQYSQKIRVHATQELATKRGVLDRSKFSKMNSRVKNYDKRSIVKGSFKNNALKNANTYFTAVCQNG